MDLIMNAETARAILAHNFSPKCPECDDVLVLHGIEAHYYYCTKCQQVKNPADWAHQVWWRNEFDKWDGPTGEPLS